MACASGVLYHQIASGRNAICYIWVSKPRVPQKITPGDSILNFIRPSTNLNPITVGAAIVGCVAISVTIELDLIIFDRCCANVEPC